MITLSPCPCCEGHIITCDTCGRRSSTCSQASPGEAQAFARSIGWKTLYPSPTAPAKWLCKECSDG